MAKFIATFPEVSLDWLILGEGDMIRKTTPSPEERDIMELSRKLVEAKDEIIELQKAHIESLMERIRLMLPSRR